MLPGVCPLGGDMTTLKEGVPCEHPGCLSHLSHPCEGCGRTGGFLLLPSEESIKQEEAVQECKEENALLEQEYACLTTKAGAWQHASFIGVIRILLKRGRVRYKRLKAERDTERATEERFFRSKITRAFR
jgi:hypothetical protein